MSTFEIQIQDRATGILGRVAGLSRADLNFAIGAAVQSLFQDHFRALPPNKNHFPTTHFWRRAAASTTWQATGDGVAVRVSQEGVLYQWLGGDVQPSRVYLTIPAIGPAYGHSAREFNLRFAIVPDGNGFLRPALVARPTLSALVAHASRSATGGPKPANSNSQATVFYWLVRHVHKNPNPKVMPPADEIAKTVSAAAKSFIASLRRGN
jgi:hypothetical protein